MASLKERKEMLKKEWEECFEQKFEDKFNERGIKRFWDEDTTEDEAIEMLTCAGVDIFIDSLAKDVAEEIAGVVVIHNRKQHKDEPCNVKNGKPYRIIGKDNTMLDTEFETEEAAREYIIEQVKYSPYTVDDFNVVKVM